MFLFQTFLKLFTIYFHQFFSFMMSFYETLVPFPWYSSKSKAFPNFSRITKFLGPTGFDLFFINCLAGVLPLNGIIWSSMLLYYSSGIPLQHFLTASMTAFTFQNQSYYFLGFYWMATWRFERSLKWRFRMIASAINGTLVLLFQYMQILGNFKLLILIDAPKKPFHFFLSDIKLSQAKNSEASEILC